MAGWQKATLAIFLAGAAAAALAEGAVYSCVDAKGRRLTSDRYIADCIDREQKLLHLNGAVRLVPPTLTARERDLLADQDRKLAEERQRQAEERRAQRALLMRYPQQAVHDAERHKALQAIGDASLNAQRQIEDLRQQQATLKEETEFYAKDPSKMPPKLKRQLEEHEQQVALQQRFIAGQQDEKKRLNARFDEELARLRVLWAQAGAVASSAPASAPATR